MRLELTRSCDHYPLKVACIPISPPARRRNSLVALTAAFATLGDRDSSCQTELAKFDLGLYNRMQSFDCVCSRSLLQFVPKTGLEPARLSTLAPETSASTNSAIWASSL